MPLNKQKSRLEGLYTVELKRHVDDRGTFVKPFDLVRGLGAEEGFKVVETFFSSSKAGVIRGLHFQTPPMDHSKLVLCLQGRVLDVVVDLRLGSPTYGEAETFELDARKPMGVFIPKGFAHGFYSHEDDSIMGYWVDSGHAPENDAGLLWSSVDVKWPTKSPIISPRDAGFPGLKEFQSPFSFKAV